MAVYTALSSAQIQRLLRHLQLGRLIDARGVAAGVENTTYFVTVEESPDQRREYVLTLAETASALDLRFSARFTQALQAAALPVPTPVRARSGTAVFKLNGRPAVLVPKARGGHIDTPTPAHCAAIGRTLAAMHRVASDCHLRHESHRSLVWVAARGNQLLEHVSRPDRSLLKEELTVLSKFVSTNFQLSSHPIHGDLFRDNVLFSDGEISAVIDFFSAGDGWPLFDLAVVANDWCRAGEFLPARLRALQAGYEASRPLSPLEKSLWGSMLRIAALRFWVSRLSEALLGDAVRPRGSGKLPDEYRDLLVLHRDTPRTWEDLQTPPRPDGGL